ncbi:hypothetical protein D3C71_1221950 [compost metagenome]
MSTVSETNYVTTWGFFFASGPGFWKAKPSYWISWGIAVFMLLFVSWILAMGIFGFLFVASIVSKKQWRHQEIERAIRESAGKTADSTVTPPPMPSP